MFEPAKECWQQFIITTEKYCILQSRDDQNDYERNQRLALRVQQQQMEHLNAQQEMVNRSMSMSTYIRSPSPVRLQPFSNAAMVQLSEKIKSEEQFSSSLPVRKIKTITQNHVIIVHL